MDPEWCVGVRWDRRWFKIIPKTVEKNEGQHYTLDNGLGWYGWWNCSRLKCTSVINKLSPQEQYRAHSFPQNFTKLCSSKWSPQISPLFTVCMCSVLWYGCDDKSLCAINTRYIGHHLLECLLPNWRLAIPHGTVWSGLTSGLLE